MGNTAVGGRSQYGKSTFIAQNLLKEFKKFIRLNSLTFLLQNYGEYPKDWTNCSELVLLFNKISLQETPIKRICITEFKSRTGVIQKMIDFRTRKILKQSRAKFHTNNRSILLKIRAIALQMWQNYYMPDSDSIRTHLQSLIQIKKNSNAGNIFQQTSKINQGLQFILHQLHLVIQEDETDQQHNLPEQMNIEVSQDEDSQISLEPLMDEQELNCPLKYQQAQIKDYTEIEWRHDSKDLFERLLTENENSSKFEYQQVKPLRILNSCTFASVE